MKLARPADRAAMRQWLVERRLDWAEGVTWVAGDAPRWSALVRAVEPNPGDGYHREHVRELEAAGSPAALGGLLREAVRALGGDVRVEARAAQSEGERGRLLTAAGLVEEARLPGGWRAGRDLEDLVLHGRPAARPRGPAPPPVRLPPPDPSARVAAWRLHDASTRAALARFLEGLGPGRAYPPGTLLSEAERGETRRRGDLDLPWLLALDSDGPDGEVLGGVVIERAASAARRHVARVHADVVAAARGRGVASELLRRARELAGRLGASRVEADPREGNVAVRRALAAAGFTEVGRQRAAWRLRAGAQAWDEDVVLVAAPATVIPPRQPAGEG